MKWILRRPRNAECANGPPCAVKDVGAKRDHRDNIEQHNPPDPKAAHDVRIDVAMRKKTRGPDRTGCEMKNVNDDENEKESSTPTHRTGREGGCLRLISRISVVARGAILHRELICGDHVEYDRDDQNSAYNPKELAGAFEKMRV